MMKLDVFNVRSDFNNWSASGVEWMSLLPVYLDDKETAQLSTERPGMSEPFVSSGADESVQKVRGIDVSLSGPSIRQLSEMHAAVLQVPCKHLKKTDRVSRPFFKNRKFTVDVGKMWPDCNGCVMVAELF